MCKPKRVPSWIRNMKPGLLRSYLAFVTRSKTRQERRENSSFWPAASEIEHTPNPKQTDADQ